MSNTLTILHNLTDYERKIVRLLMLEASNQQISDYLAISIPSVVEYLLAIFKKLNVTSRYGVIVFMYQMQTEQDSLFLRGLV